LRSTASPAVTARPLPLLAIARQTAAGPVVALVYGADRGAKDVAVLSGNSDGSIDAMAWSADGRLALAGQPTGTGLGVHTLDPATGRLGFVGGALDSGCPGGWVDSLAWAGRSIVVDAIGMPPADRCVDGLVELDPATGTRVHIDAPVMAVRWAVSPDGQAIAHDGWAGPHAMLWISDLVTGASQVVGTLQWKTTPAWSPDGSRALYVDEQGELLATPRAATGSPLDLASAAPAVVGFSHVGWGTDADTVFFRSWTRRCRTDCDGFYRLDISARRLTRIVALPDIHADWRTNYGYVFDWSLSPDGAQIAYDLTPAPGRPTEIRVVDAHGRSAPRTISAAGEDTTLLGWASAGVVAYRTKVGLVLAAAVGSGRSVIAVPNITAVALASRSIVHRGA
jgi:hypothetical protein